MDLIGNDINYAVTESVWTRLLLRPEVQTVLRPKTQC